MSSDAVSGGFAAPVFAAQAGFRAAMDALSRPGLPHVLPGDAAPPAPLTQGQGVLLLTLADGDTPVWLHAGGAQRDAVASWLAFHTGAPLVEDPALAAFCVLDISALLPLSRFRTGSDEYPDRSATLLVAVPGFLGATGLTLQGPGIDGTVGLPVEGLPSGFVEAWGANGRLFPRGVDILFTAGQQLVGLPRTSRMMEAR